MVNKFCSNNLIDRVEEQHNTVASHKIRIYLSSRITFLSMLDNSLPNDFCGLGENLNIAEVTEASYIIILRNTELDQKVHRAKRNCCLTLRRACSSL
jgi:hypothetical protein